MRKSATLILFLLISFAGFAQQTILWRVSWGDSAESWLMGTRHSAPLAILELQPKIYEAYTQSSTIFFETDFDKLDEEISAYYDKRPVNSFWASLSSDDSSLLATTFNARKIDYQKLSPAEASLFIIGMLGAGANCFDSSHDLTNLDAGLFEKAQNDNKSLRFLEAGTYQLEVLEQLAGRFGKNIGRKLLAVYLKKLKTREGNTNCKELIKYMNMDLDYHFRKMPAVPDVALLDRNNNWMKILPDSLKMGSCFVAVGLAHLDGSKGLIRQLQEKGFTVEPVTLELNTAHKLLSAKE